MNDDSRPVGSSPPPEVATHRAIDPELCGRAVELASGFSRVQLTPSQRMAADEHGLVHGGFPFGLADYAAMLAVNAPLVVLAAAEVRFLLPVRVGEALEAEARRVEGAGDAAKPIVEVTVTRRGELVMSGRFRCYVPRRHVLEGQVLESRVLENISEEES